MRRKSRKTTRKSRKTKNKSIPTKRSQTSIPKRRNSKQVTRKMNFLIIRNLYWEYDNTFHDEKYGKGKRQRLLFCIDNPIAFIKKDVDKVLKDIKNEIKKNNTDVENYYLSYKVVRIDKEISIETMNTYDYDEFESEDIRIVNDKDSYDVIVNLNTMELEIKNMAPE